uniref:F-box domain-containing protein n=1 Tax=Panagrellus redivivus TaxID=6233 RepID=A0A7E5A1Z4_PANRE
MTTLKTHLLFEALDIAFEKMNRLRAPRGRRAKPDFWGFGPKETCAFAISSSHAYRMLAYTVKNFATCVDEDPGRLCIGVFNEKLNVSVISFSQECHIDVLMGLAGNHCTNIVDKFDRADNDFTEPFYYSLADNQVLCTDTIDRDAKAFRAYIKGRDVIPSVKCNLYSDDYYHCLQDVKDTVINKLTVAQVFPPVTASTFDALANLRVVNLEFTDERSFNAAGVYFDIFYKSKPKLKYMKSFHFHNPITVSVALQMLQRYDIDKMQLTNVCFEKMRSPFEEYITELRKTVDTIWKTIDGCKRNKHRHVECRFANQIELVHQPQGYDVVSRLNEVLPDFNTITAPSDVVKCLFKTKGKKKLFVVLRFGLIV